MKKTSAALWKGVSVDAIMPTRREFLAGFGAAAIVVGFDIGGRRWVTAAQAAARGCDFSGVPPLDGRLLQDRATLAEHSHDLGNMARSEPCALLQPGSVLDIQKMVRFCRTHGIKVSARGSGHTMFGQSLSPGLMILMRSLDKIHSIAPQGADVDAGVLWPDLLRAAYEKGLTPPAMVGFKLTIAGTLSVGGVPGTPSEGVQLDRVQELEVVTGTGELVRCSVTENRELFDVVLGGLGQCGVITRAKLDLVPAPQRVRRYEIHYTDVATLFSDWKIIRERGEFDDAVGMWHPNGSGLSPVLALSAFYDLRGTLPDRLRLLRGLSIEAQLALERDMGFIDHKLEFDTVVDALMLTGWGELTKPWFDVFLPESKAEQFVAEVAPWVPVTETRPGALLLLFAINRAKLSRPFFRIPEDDGGKYIFLFDILGASLLPHDQKYARQMLRRNRRLYEKARDLGGTLYPIGATPMRRRDWMRQYGNMWPELVRRKQLYDPANILGPGPGIF